MIRHDAHTDLDVFSDYGSEDPNMPGMDFPLPVQGNQSPNVLALGMIGKITFVYGIFILLIRLIGLSYPDVALILSYVIAAAFAIAFCIKWFAPERGMMEWPVWLGAAVVMLFAANRYFPDSILSAPLPPNTSSQAVIPLLFQVGIILVVIVIYLSPSVKNLLSTKTRGPLALGAVGCLIGGRWAAIGYVPESDFASWNFLAMSLLVVCCTLQFVTDQYVRFEKATTPGSDWNEQPVPFQKWFDAFPHHHSALGLIILAASLWLGNLVFLNTLHCRGANEFGLLAFLGPLAGFGVIGALARPNPLSPNPILSAWNALSFWLTYNLQRNSNPNVFQCLPWFREPLIRFGLVGAAMTVLSLSLLHLSGVHGAKGRNKEKPDAAFSFMSRFATPQSYPKLIEKCELNKDAKAVYDHWSETLVKEGDAPLPPRRPLRSLGDLLYSAILFFVGGPVLFFFLLVTTQGNYIARRLSKARELYPEE